MYLVIFCYWVGPVPYLELFGAGPVEKNTLYNIRNGQLNVKITSLLENQCDEILLMCPAAFICYVSTRMSFTSRRFAASFLPRRHFALFTHHDDVVNVEGCS